MSFFANSQGGVPSINQSQIGKIVPEECILYTQAFKAHTSQYSEL